MSKYQGTKGRKRTTGRKRTMRGAGPGKFIRRLLATPAPAPAPPPVQFPERERSVRIATGASDTPTKGMFIGSIDGGAGEDAICEIQYNAIKLNPDNGYTIQLASIIMGSFKGKHLCKHLFRETLRHTLMAFPKVGKFKVNSMGTNNERGRALNCYNTVLEEFQFKHTMGDGDWISPALSLDPTEAGTRYWSR